MTAGTVKPNGVLRHSRGFTQLNYSPVVLSLKVTFWRCHMTTYAVSVSEFKAHCLDMIRQVEKAGTAVDLVRRGKSCCAAGADSVSAAGYPRMAAFARSWHFVCAPRRIGA